MDLIFIFAGLIVVTTDLWLRLQRLLLVSLIFHVLTWWPTYNPLLEKLSEILSRNWTLLLATVYHRWLYIYSNYCRLYWLEVKLLSCVMTLCACAGSLSFTFIYAIYMMTHPALLECSMTTNFSLYSLIYQLPNHVNDNNLKYLALSKCVLAGENGETVKPQDLNKCIPS